MDEENKTIEAEVTEVAPEETVERDVKEEKAARKKRLREWKKEARQKGKQYVARKKASVTRESKREFKKETRKAVREWKRSLRGLEADEVKDQKKAYKTFKRRTKRAKRLTGWAALTALIAFLAVCFGSVFAMLFKTMASQKYTDKTDAAKAAREVGYALSAEICDEGFVLLKNDGGFLPLQTKKLAVFGDDAYNFVYGGSGSAGADQTGAATLFDGLEKAGIAYDTQLDSYYRENLGKMDSGTGSTWEMIVSFFTGRKDDGDWLLPGEEQLAEARAFSDTALIVLSSQEVEGSELQLAQLQPMKEGTRKQQLIDEVCRRFAHVIVVVNSGNVMELGFLDRYDSVDSCLWVGAPGEFGCIELARVLTGEVNPSGRTVDTWPVSIEAEPAQITYADQAFANIKGLHFYTYNEGIYVGYRYYETWYGNDAARYDEQVVFPFGSGLSYTEFTEEMTSFTNDGKNVTVRVKVTNIGGRAGKDVVELYFSAPWHPENGIEKSVIELAAFGKTGELAPGASETLTLSFPIRDMASYSVTRQAYILEQGQYRVMLGKNVHEALLNEFFQTVTIGQDVIYANDEVTGTPIRNLFGFADGGIETMSRRDPVGTFPKANGRTEAPAELKEDLEEYEKYLSAYSALEPPVTGAENGIELADLRGLAFDDPKWERFLDQFTADELISLSALGGWHTEAVERLGVPGSRLLDGPSGINSMMSPVDAVAYPMETVISSSWNTELAAKLGSAIGDEANALGVNGWYAPAMNLHRNSIGGRNSEYYSEDPLLSGKMAAATIAAVQDKGVIAFMKHFVCNDLEQNARSNVSVLVNEQALRELYLRPFELAVKEGGAAGVMDSFSRLGARWCGGCSALMKDLLREEWGFRGVATTDAALGGWMNAEAAAKNGNDLMLDMGIQNSVKKLQKACEKDPAGVLWSLRDCAHDLCYALVNYTELTD